MAKKSKRQYAPPPVSGLDPAERELFLKAFFTGEIERDTTPKNISIKDNNIINNPKITNKECIILDEEEQHLFLQAFNEIIIGTQAFASEPKSYTKAFSGKKRKHADGFLDLHGMVAEDAVKALLDFLKYEKKRGSKTLLVVHGKGAGILRNAVWAVLETHPAVNDFQIAPSRFGGEGALIVRINRKLR
jgi:DNA-nicking Smr family endonuclease